MPHQKTTKKNDPVLCQMVFNKPYNDLVSLTRSKVSPSVSSHMGSIYYTVRHSTVLNFQPGETQKVNVKLKTDYDILSTHEARHDIPHWTTYSEELSNDFSHELPFHGDVAEMSDNLGRVYVEFPDGFMSP